MSRFKGGDLNLSPLKLQLTTDGNAVSLVEWRASLQAEEGTSWSRPQLTHPGTIGTTTLKVASVPVDGPGTATASVISQFATQPSLPAASPIINSVPSYVSYQWQAGEGAGWLVYNGDALLLYALANTGATWDGEMVFEEL